MNSDIMLLSNKLIYSDRLRCGSEEVAKQSLKLPNHDFLRKMHGGKLTCHQKGCWIQQLMSERYLPHSNFAVMTLIHRNSCKAVFVDTDLVPARDSRVGDLVQNEIEATLLAQVAETLLHSGIAPEQIGVISLYRQQLKLLTQLLHGYQGLELLTADRSQGRDKDCILISMVRSNDDGVVCLVDSSFSLWLNLFLADWGSGQGLAANERLFHASTLKAHHLWFSKDTPGSSSVEGVLCARGRTEMDHATPRWCSYQS